MDTRRFGNTRRSNALFCHHTPSESSHRLVCPCDTRAVFTNVRRRECILDAIHGLAPIAILYSSEAREAGLHACVDYDQWIWGPLVSIPSIG